MSWGVGLLIVGIMCAIGLVVTSGIEDVENDY